MLKNNSGTKCVSKRGNKFAVIPKPKKDQKKKKEIFSIRIAKDYPWQVLTALHLDLAQFLPLEDSELLSQIIRNRDVYCLGLLYEEWNLQCCIKFPIDIPLEQFRAKYLLCSLLYKFQFETDSTLRRSAAISKFIKAEEHCKQFNEKEFLKLTNARTDEEIDAFTYALSFIKAVIGEELPSFDKLTEWSRHGPGSNLDTRDGLTNIYFKYENWPYSCTQLTLSYAKLLIQTDERWIGYLDDSYRERFNIPKTMILNQKVFWDTVLKVEDHNKIAFVPKNSRTDRSIAIEPALNLYLQLGVDGFIRSRLKRWDINLDDQTKNQRLARIGSINKQYSTLDLSSASDTVSLKICKILLPKEWYNYLLDLRSPKGKLDETFIEYEKISSMGNGFTFAIESLIFAALTYGAVRARIGHVNMKEDLAIFGDDIIVRGDCAELTIRMLNNAGFALNIEKSFLDGFARESCGTDWIHGKPVRPIFFNELPTLVTDLFTDYNRIKRILDLYFGIEESNALNYIKARIPKNFLNIIGPYSDEDFSSYIHSSRPKVLDPKNGIFKYKRLIIKSMQVSGSKFFARKLMHDLRPIRPFQFQGPKKIQSSGSRFTITRSNTFIVCRTFSHASHWCDEYHAHIA